MRADEKFPFEKWLVQGIRLGIYLLIVGLAVFQDYTQGQFFETPTLQIFYGVSIFGILLHGFESVALNFFFLRPALVKLSFFADFLGLSVLFFLTQLNPSIFLFLDLLMILLVGLVFGTRVSLLAAAGFSSVMTLNMALGPEVKSLSFFFLLVLNNLAFFSIATISGFLAEQLEIQGLSLSALRKLNEKIVETVPSALITIDSSGAVLATNPQALLLFPELSLANVSLRDILPNFEVENYLGRGKVDLPCSREGETQSLSVQCLKTTIETKEAFLIVVDDLTQVRKLEYAVRQSEKMAAVGQLAAGIAHEIRNPLAGISGSIELLSEHAQNEDDKKLNRIILKEIDRLNLLISEFLDFAKPEKPPIDVVDLAVVMTEVLDSIKLDARFSKSVEQVRSYSSGLFVRAHRDKLKQAFLNMAINAYQAMEGRPVQRFQVIGDKKDDFVRLVFEDTGCGMTQQTQQRMFEPFHTTKPKGTGLGLAITMKVIENHRGQIFVESEQDQGTRIEIRFPQALEDKKV